MNKSEQLIACLEGEIAKRDEELAACRVSVENCEVFRARIAELEADRDSHQRCAIQAMAELAAIKAQEPVEYQLRALIRDVTNIPEAGYYMPQSWHDQVIALSLSGKLDAPVSEDKAQGVVMPEGWIPLTIEHEPGYPEDVAFGPKRMMDRLKKLLDRYFEMRLNAAPVQQVSVPDGFVLAKETVVEMPDGSRELGYTTIGRVGIFNSAEEVFDAIRELDLPLGWVSMTTEQLLPGWMLNAAPAAPAADAGLLDMYRHLQKVTPYRFKKIQDASITDGGDVMYFHKDRFDAALLADMAAHCAAKGAV